MKTCEKQMSTRNRWGHFELYLLLLVLGLSSCKNLSDFCGGCRPPDESISEMATLGVTISSETTPFPLSINQYFVTDQTVSGDVTLYFAPPEDRISTIESIQSRYSTFPYEYTYSQEIDGRHVEIPGHDHYHGPSEVDHFSNYYGGIANSHMPSELLLGSSHLLSSPRVFVAPIRATHVELWYREDEDSERTLIRRVQLSNLYAWRTYFIPLIEDKAKTSIQDQE